MNSKVVKKKKPVDGSKMAQEQVELFEKATKARYRIALAAYNAQDVVTKNVIDSIRDRLSTMATGYIRVFPHGKQQQSVPVKISQELVDSNILFMATEILKDLAFMDVQVGNYKFGKVYCAECGDKLTPRKKHGK